MFWSALEARWSDWSCDLALMFPHLAVPDIAPFPDDRLRFVENIASAHDLTPNEVAEILDDLTLNLKPRVNVAKAVAA